VEFLLGHLNFLLQILLEWVGAIRLFDLSFGQLEQTEADGANKYGQRSIGNQGDDRASRNQVEREENGSQCSGRPLRVTPVDDLQD
jgi:hypothetical protein